MYSEKQLNYHNKKHVRMYNLTSTNPVASHLRRRAAPSKHRNFRKNDEWHGALDVEHLAVEQRQPN